MVDPINFTNFNHTLSELEEKILFSVLVAGKNALTTAKSLDLFLRNAQRELGWQGPLLPFSIVRQFTIPKLQKMLLRCGIGCYTSKAKSIYQLAHSRMNLRECSVEELEKIHGIGPKTARMYILHTRPNAKVAALDVHILRYMADCGEDVPKTTPIGKKYKQIEAKFLEMADEAGQSVADFDLMIWRKYSGRDVA